MNYSKCELPKADNRWIFPVAGAGLAMIISFTSQLGTFAVLDDYRMILSVRTARGFVIEGHAATEWGTGRVIPALLFNAVWGGVDEVNDLWYLRLIGFLTVAVGVVLFQIWFIRTTDLQSKYSLLVIGISTFLVMLLPAMSATTTWAQKATQLLALPLSFSAGILAVARKSSLRRWGLVFLLIMMSTFTYQHFSAIAIHVVIVHLFLQQRRAEVMKGIQKVIVVGLFVTFSLALNILFVRIVADDVLKRIADRSLANRISEYFNVLTKGAHVLIDKSLLSLVFSGAFILVLITITWIPRNQGRRLVIATGFSAIIVAGVTLGADGDSSYRLILPTQMIIWLGLGIAFAQSVELMIPERIYFGRVMALCFLSLATLFSAYEAHVTVHDRIYFVNHNDWAQVNCHLRSVNASRTPNEIVIRLAPIRVTGANAVASEIGLQARHIAWVFRDQWHLAIESESDFKSLAKVSIRLLDFDAAIPLQTNDTIVIDLQTLCRDT